MNPSPTRCRAIGALTVGGVEVAAFRCDRDAGHASGYFPRIEAPAPGDVGTKRVLLEPTPHRYVLTWADDGIELMPSHELFDPDESFDVDVPIDETERDPFGVPIVRVVPPVGDGSCGCGWMGATHEPGCEFA